MEPDLCWIEHDPSVLENVFMHITRTAGIKTRIKPHSIRMGTIRDLAHIESPNPGVTSETARLSFIKLDQTVYWTDIG